MANNTEQRIVEVVLRGQQANASLKEMEASARGLRAQLRNLTPGTQEFIDKTKSLQQINSRLKKINDDVKGVGGVFSKIGGEIKAFGILAAGYLGFDFITSKIKNIIAQNAKLSDSFSDIQKTTGMTEKEVRNLNKALGEINTRTSGDELRKIAVAAGQLGIAKGDILKFTDATDKLVVSLGDEFAGGAEEVTKQMGGLRNSFLDIKTDNIANDMLHIGNAINELGSSGSATGPVIADFANRIGGVGITMGLTSGQVLGLSATLQELNVSTERGGTAVVKILQKMTTDTDSFAKVAGMSTKEFTSLLNKDLYGAFVKVAAGAKAQGSSATALAKILDSLGVEGAGASEVFAKLGNNTDLLKRRVDLATQSLQGTNSIMNEFNTKNNNMAADLERIGKGISGIFANSAISDGLKSITGWMAKLFENTHAESEALQEEINNLSLAETEIFSYNAGNENRTKLIKQLQEQYPEYLKNIDAETVSNSELHKAIDKVNNSLVNKLVIQKKDEELQEQADIAAEKRLNAEEIKRKINQNLTDLYNRDARSMKMKKEMEGIDLMTQAQMMLDFDVQKQAGYSQFNSIILDLRKNYNDWVDAQIQSNSELIKTQDLMSEKEEIMKNLGMNMTDIDNSGKEEIKSVKNTASQEITIDEETRKKLLDERKKYLEKLAALEDEYRLSHMTKEEQEEFKIFKKYDELFAEAKKFNTGESLLLKDRSNELSQLYADMLDTHKSSYKEMEFIEVDHFLKTGELLKKTRTDWDAANQLKEASSQITYDDILKNYDAFIAAIAGKRDQEEPDPEEQFKKWQAAFQKKLQLFQHYQSQVNKIVSLFNESEDRAAAARSKQIDINREKELATQKTLLDKKVISEQEYQRRVDKINGQADKNKIDIERKAAERKRKMAIFDVGVNTIVAVSEAIPNPIKMAAAAALGFAQLALVIGKPAPYAKGGMTSFADGGEVNKPHIALAGEAGREWIAPNWMVESPIYGPTIQAMEKVRTRAYSGGGNTISTGVTRTATPKETTIYRNSDHSDLIAAINRLNDHLDRGIISKLDYDGYQKDLGRINNAKK